MVGGCAVLVIVVVAIALAITIPRFLKDDREAKVYVKEVVPKIVSPWNSQALLDQATPEMLEAMTTPSQTQALFTFFEKLGALKHLDDPAGGVKSMSFTGQGSGTYGNYQIPAQFDAGEASIQIQVKQVDRGWKINEFRVNSKAFLVSPTPVPAANT